MKPNPLLSRLDGVLHDGLQFCSMVYALFEEVRRTEDGKIRLRMRASSLEKHLIEELLPICKYIQFKYRVGRYISIKWVHGSQSFDAEFQQTGAYVEQGYSLSAGYLEVTCVMHPNEYLSRELLTKSGVTYGLNGIKRLKTGEITSEPVGYTNSEFVHEYAKLVLQQLTKKSKISYPKDTTLIVQCWLNIQPYTPQEWEMLVTEVRRGLPEHQFWEIFMFDADLEYSCTI